MKSAPPWICAIESPDIQDRYNVHPLRVTETGLESGHTPFELVDPRSHRRQPLVAIEGDAVWAVTSSRCGQRPILICSSLSGAEPQRAVRLRPPSSPRDFPATILAHRGTCYIGWNAEVHAIRLTDRDARTSVLRCPGCPDWKPFDVLCVAPPFMLAIDDIVMPKWRMCIDVTDPEVPSVLYGHRLSEDHAETEFLAAVQCNGRMVLLATYANRYGAGTLLQLVQPGRSGIAHLSELHLSRADGLTETRHPRGTFYSESGDPSWHAGPQPWPSRRPGRVRSLVDRMPFTTWSALAAIGSKLFVATTRGLLRCNVTDEGFELLPRANIGDCLDLVACGGDLVALVQSAGGRDLLQLRPEEAQGLRAICRIRVDDRVSRLVGS